MSNHPLFTGPTGMIYSAITVITLLSIMLIISLRLYRERRKKAYSSLILSLSVVLIQYSLIVSLSYRIRMPGDEMAYIVQLLQVVSFIFINMAVFQMYNRSGMRVSISFFSFLAITAGVAALHYVFLESLDDPTQRELLLNWLGIDIYQFVLIFLAFFLISPNVGQAFKYNLCLFFFFGAHLAQVIKRYVYDGSNGTFELLANVLPIAYYAVLLLFIIDRVVELLQATYYSSIRDGLTGVYNRTFFIQKVKEAIKQKKKAAVIFTDIDNFKRLNDTQGHQKGDEALRAVASVIKETADDYGIAGRYGGEELVMMITSQTPASVKKLAELVRRTVEEQTPVTVSVGYSIWRDGVSAEQLLKEADEAMYTSKTTGKNKVTAYSSKRA
ncbi:diguanylate cyclase [Xylanibacillus composti]|uniref:GGDEF domain-containing protein n=1 Tax=Xylanibacillus composti TaxID=1572762 RepID=A0A8J4M3W9_9BACL|nr:GGDEF domain-containing protein [Xylanibacillus composti]MDT9725002.1 diguanylate cyclase [Xylanibacillus composti]GIQ71295.1 hypothetical protein XYCOK13_41190 [Xylanibacillus composti]